MQIMQACLTIYSNCHGHCLSSSPSLPLPLCPPWRRPCSCLYHHCAAPKPALCSPTATNALCRGSCPDAAAQLSWSKAHQSPCLPGVEGAAGSVLNLERYWQWESGTCECGMEQTAKGISTVRGHALLASWSNIRAAGIKVHQWKQVEGDSGAFVSSITTFVRSSGLSDHWQVWWVKGCSSGKYAGSFFLMASWQYSTSVDQILLTFTTSYNCSLATLIKALFGLCYARNCSNFDQ